MTANAFFDTNILLYFFSDAGQSTAVAERLLVQGGVVSVQVLNEFVSVAHGKLKMSWDEIRAAMDKTLVFCPNPIPLTQEIYFSAVEIAARYGYHIYDSLILAAAIKVNCATVYTEDVRHGQTIEKLTIVNPFLAQ
jgi:predicted nucleic acid-binding protein